MHCTERVRDAFSCVRWRKMNLTRRVLVHRPLAHFFPQISLSFIFLAYISHPAMQHRTPLTPIPQNRSPPPPHPPMRPALRLPSATRLPNGPRNLHPSSWPSGPGRKGNVKRTPHGVCLQRNACTWLGRRPSPRWPLAHARHP